MGEEEANTNKTIEPTLEDENKILNFIGPPPLSSGHQGLVVPLEQMDPGEPGEHETDVDGRQQPALQVDAGRRGRRRGGERRPQVDCAAAGRDAGRRGGGTVTREAANATVAARRL